jgi:Mg2+/citrate symporter
MAINSSNLVLALIVEGVGLGVITLLAGASDDVGTVMVVFMVGLWLLFLVNHPNVQTFVSNITANTQRSLNG